MKFSKTQKAFVIEWIEKQFASDQLFPCDCAAQVDGEPHICTAHMKAYKAWSLTPHKRSHIRDWIDDWMNPAEQQALEGALKKQALRCGEQIE